MDPLSDPYAPGAGSPPPALAGRDDLLERFRIASGRLVLGRQSKSAMLVGSRGVVAGMKVRYGDLEIAIERAPEPGLADSGDLELDLQDLFESAGTVAKRAGSAIVMFVDELQYVPEPELAALVVALHRTAQRRLPVMLVGAGPPQLAGRMGRAKSYAERLFDFPEIGPLAPEPARRALEEPAAQEGVRWAPDALDEAVAIAASLDRDVRSLGPLRAKLIEKGMVYSPSHGDTGFTVPPFDAFMRRIMPGPSPSASRGRSS